MFGRQTTRSTSRLFDQITSYLHQDPFNLLDFSALSACLCGCSMLCLEKAYGAGQWVASDAVDPTLSVGVLLMWVRQLRLLTLIAPDLSPLVLMVANMFQDVFQFLLLLTILLFGFSSAIVPLFTEDLYDNVDDAQADPFFSEADDDLFVHARLLKAKEGLGACRQTVDGFYRLHTSLVHLFEISLTGDLTTDFKCMAYAKAPITGSILMFSYTMLVALLLLNMLSKCRGPVLLRGSACVWRVTSGRGPHCDMGGGAAEACAGTPCVRESRIRHSLTVSALLPPVRARPPA